MREEDAQYQRLEIFRLDCATCKKRIIFSNEAQLPLYCCYIQGLHGFDFDDDVQNQSQRPRASKDFVRVNILVPSALRKRGQPWP